jgi:hypothetical protein
LGHRVLAEKAIAPYWNGRRFESVLGRRSGTLQCVLPFEVASDAQERLEFRARSTGALAVKLMAVVVRRVGEPYAEAEVTALRSP